MLKRKSGVEMWPCTSQPHSAGFICRIERINVTLNLIEFVVSIKLNKALKATRSATLRCYGDDISKVPLRKDCIKIKYSHFYEAARGIFSVSSFLYL